MSISDELFLETPTNPATTNPATTNPATNPAVNADFGLDATNAVGGGGGEMDLYTPEELEALGLHADTPRTVVVYGAPKIGKSTGVYAAASAAGNALILVTDQSLMNGYVEYLKAERARGVRLAVPMPLTPSRAQVETFTATLAGKSDEEKKSAMRQFRESYFNTALSRPGIKYLVLDRGEMVDPVEALQKGLKALLLAVNYIKEKRLPRHMIVVDEVFQWALDAETYIRADKLDSIPEASRQAVRVERWKKYGVHVKKDGEPDTANIWGIQAVVDGQTRRLTLSLKNDTGCHCVLITQKREYKRSEVKGKTVEKKEGPLLGIQESAPKTASHEVDAIIEIVGDRGVLGTDPLVRKVHTEGSGDSYRGHRLSPDTPAEWGPDTVGPKVAGTKLADYTPDIPGLFRFWGLIG